MVVGKEPRNLSKAQCNWQKYESFSRIPTYSSFY